ncbi:hypothetical protein M569_02289 [Genlisea aurea]|uniref:Uncharacterized protein n=1 Tax=Genlisea aurea TaxID=192259 RepID=S8CZH3_9LAMI|nr:hypothetical protein M569_02289 [Genlisea aurea]
MDRDLDFDKYCVLERSPTTVLPSPRRNRLRVLRSEDSNLGRRRSVHRNSVEVGADRKKIEFSSENASALFSSGGVADLLCSSDEDKERNVSSLMSISEQSTSFDPPPVAPDTRAASLSPAHLRGILRVENRNEGGSFFEFSTLSLEGNYTARRWDGLSSWIYTFHCDRSKGNSSSKWKSFKDSRRRIKRSSLIGQMIVTSHISGEEEEEEEVTEYVLYNSAQVRPGTETGGIVIRAPSKKKRRSSKLKNKQQQQHHGDEEDVESSSSSCALRKVHVVIPDGNHSFPGGGGDSGGPSSLLDRWRSGGVCDCGGWDMACRFDVFTSPDIRIDHRNPSQQLFVQGSREAKAAAFSMHRVDDDGSYSVEFHAKLSALQVFSICIAILHSSSQAPSPMKNRENGGSSSQRVFAEEKLDDMVFVSDGKAVYPSVVLNPPPFSPMARVV